MTHQLWKVSVTKYLMILYTACTYFKTTLDYMHDYSLCCYYGQYIFEAMYFVSYTTFMIQFIISSVNNMSFRTGMITQIAEYDVCDRLHDFKIWTQYNASLHLCPK